MTQLRVAVGPDDHILGDESAPVTLVEYGDYECPHCGAAYPEVERVRQHFGADLCFVYRHFPLTEIHPDAASAAETAEFAAAHRRFWEAHGLLFENQDRLGPALYFAIAANLGLPEFELRDALARGAHAAKIQRDFLGGVRSGVNGTPTFFINGQRHEGPFQFAYLASAIELRRAHV